MPTIVDYPQQDLGTKAFAASGVIWSDDYVPRPGGTTVLHIEADQAGDAQSFEIDPSGEIKSLGAAVSFTANTTDGSADETHTITRPARRLRMKYTNTSAVAGTARFWAVQ